MSTNTNNMNTGIQTMFLYMGMLNNFKTDDSGLGLVMNYMIYLVMGYYLLNMFNILTIKYYLSNLIAILRYYWKKYISKKEEIIKKDATIKYITGNKKKNYLYESVDWYLYTKLNEDMIHETPIECSFEEPVGVMHNKEYNTNIKITNNKYKKFTFKDYEIYYIRNTNLITVYSDQERKKENYEIRLSTTVKAKDTRDILKEFCDYCLTEHAKSKMSTKWEQKIFVNNKDGKWTSSKSNNGRRLDTVILKENQLNDLKKDIDDFIESEDWYHDRDIPYTRGYLLYGPPGTGKTSLIKGISNYTKRDMHYLILDNVKSDDQLIELLKINYKNTILIIEDIDCISDIVKSRKDNNINSDNIKKMISEQLKKHINQNGYMEDSKSTLSLSGLLNAIDGIFNHDGRILIMTSNHPEKLDHALIRSGRVDRKIECSNCDFEQVKNIYKMMFDEEFEINEEDFELDNIYSPADYTSLFLRFKNNPQDITKNLDKIEHVSIKKKLYNKTINPKLGINTTNISNNISNNKVKEGTRDNPLVYESDNDNSINTNTLIRVTDPIPIKNMRDCKPMTQNEFNSAISKLGMIQVSSADNRIGFN